MALSFHMVWTITLLVIFIGIVYWAWNDRRKDDFEEASMLPLESDEQLIDSKAIKAHEKRDNHG